MYYYAGFVYTCINAGAQLFLHIESYQLVMKKT